MNDPIVNIPIVNVQSEIKFSPAVIKLWTNACLSVKDAQEKFCKAYEATIVCVCGKDWRTRWQNDPYFIEMLEKVEEYIWSLCKSADFSLTTFNRYKLAARKSVLLNVSFSMARSLTLRQLHAIKREAGQDREKAEELAKQAGRRKRLQDAVSCTKKVAAVFPYPEEESADEYMPTAKMNLSNFLHALTEKYGIEKAQQLLLDLLKEMPS